MVKLRVTIFSWLTFQAFTDPFSIVRVQLNNLWVIWKQRKSFDSYGIQEGHAISIVNVVISTIGGRLILGISISVVVKILINTLYYQESVVSHFQTVFKIYKIFHNVNLDQSFHILEI